MTREYIQFNNQQEWINYVTTHMKNANKLEGVNQIVLQDGNNETIAVWQSHGTGCIYEGRSEERLQKDIT